MIRRLAIGGASATAALALVTLAPARSASPVDGAALYQENCAACHQPSGEGIAGAFPALAGDAFVQGDPAAIAKTLINGRNAMPAFRDVLTDAQLAAILSHVRASWGNKAAPIGPETFATARTAKPAG